RAGIVKGIAGVFSSIDTFEDHGAMSIVRAGFHKGKGLVVQQTVDGGAVAKKMFELIFVVVEPVYPTGDTAGEGGELGAFEVPALFLFYFRRAVVAVDDLQGTLLGVTDGKGL